MAQILSSAIFSNRQRPTGARRIKFRFVVEDNDSATKEVFRTLRNVPSDFDTAAWLLANESTVLDQEANEEEISLEDISSGQNPLTISLSPRWSTTKKIAKKLIRWMMREKDPRIVLYLEPLIVYIQANYNATQIANLLDITTTEVQRMNRRVNAILSDTGTAKALLADFDAEEGEVED